MLEKLPPELLTEILTRLPVDCLLRFRSISKSWCAKIDDPNFIKTHLKKSRETNSNLTLIFAGSHPDYFYNVNLDSLNSIIKLENPIKGPTDASHNIKIVGSCNGLLCFGNASGRITLMNPSTRKHKVLPFLRMDASVKGKSVWGAWAFGFGCDSVHDDYKVIRLGQYLDFSLQQFETDTMVYSLKSNSWRKIDGMSCIIGFDQKMGVLVGEALHWLASRDRILLNPDVIVALNLGVEDFREVPGPDVVVVGANPNQNPSLNLGVVEEWLSVFAIYNNTRLDIWVMKEYGAKDSWTRLFSFTPNVVPFVKCLRTLVFSKNRDEVLLGLQDKNLLWYKIREKRVKRVEIHIVVTLFTMQVFHGSLVPLSVNKETDSKKARPRKGKKNRDEFLSKGFKLAWNWGDEAVFEHMKVDAK
ncbi:ubiquitin-protein ligase, putative [Ricinus communis]|uniref:Ubiquitin-protein ligase, putative n=1 Tax=Ricinus communis TaxID=3988 RepID=B9SJF0_RICCO|nr:ubiquitin-protein ligase, putative [Ricinus communis]